MFLLKNYKNLVAASLTALVVVHAPMAEARSKKKASADKNSPNYTRYLEDEEYSTGRGQRLAGILLTSIGGSIGSGVLLGGILWNTCVGASGDSYRKCKRNARTAMITGGVLAGGSFGSGIPLLFIGREKMENAKSRIDQEFPFKEGSEVEAFEAPGYHEKQNPHFASKSPFGGVTLAVRVLNLKF